MSPLSLNSQFSLPSVSGHCHGRRLRRPSPMSKSRKKKKPPKRVLALPDLEQAKSAVLNTLTSKSGQRTYDHAITEFVEWYCSEPRLQPHCGPPIQNQPRTETIRAFDD